MPAPDLEHIRREAIGAFVHEMRTPLTSMRMVLEIGRRASNDAGVQLDNELVSMLEGAVRDLQGLADALQESSWLERGKLAPAATPGALDDLLKTLSKDLPGGLEVDIEPSDPVTGAWDQPRLLTAFHGFVEAANRCGSGDGKVACRVDSHDGRCAVTFFSGTPGGEPRSVNADLGYPFFHAHALMNALGGTVHVERSEGYCEIRAALPANG